MISVAILRLDLFIRLVGFGLPSPRQHHGRAGAAGTSGGCWMTMARRMAMVATLMIAAAMVGPRRSIAADDPRAVIQAALEQWRDDFNARRADHICDLFAEDLRYDFQGLPEQTYPLICERLHHALSDTTRSFHYGLRIKEIIISGDLAVVRLTWNSTLTDRTGRQVTDDEPGLDVFGRQPDGGWKIIRYIAYPAHP